MMMHGTMKIKFAVFELWCQGRVSLAVGLVS